MESKQLLRIGANFGWLIADRVLRMVFGLVVLGVVARYLGTEQFGLLRYAMGLAAIFATVANLGLDGIVIRELVKRPGETGTLLGTAWMLRLAGGVISMALLYLTALISRDGTTVARLVLIISFAYLPQSFEVIELWFQKKIEAKYAVWARTAGVLLGAALKILLVIWDMSLGWFCLAVVLDAIFSATALILVYQVRGERMIWWRPSAPMATGLLRASWPLIISGLLVALYIRVEQLLVMNFLGSGSMGIYYAAAAIPEMWNFIPALFLITIYPLVVEQREKDPSRYRAQLQTVFDLMTGFGYVVAILATLLARYIIPAIYGREYEAAIRILEIQAWTAPIVFSGLVRAQYFLMENITIYHTIAALLGIMVNLCLSLWLMSVLGARGAALAALIGYWVAGFVSSLLFSELRDCARMQAKAFLLPFRISSFLKALPWNR